MTFKVVEDCTLEKPKTIVISFDGTGGDPSWSYCAQKDENGKVPLYAGMGGLTNIVKMHLLAGGNIGNTRNYFEDQIPFYYAGPGTRGSTISKTLNSLGTISSFFAMKNIATMAYEDLMKIYKKGDKLFVFGFSRGAAIARLLVSYLDQVEDKKFDYEIDFLGVYDTVVYSPLISKGTEIQKLDVNKKSSKLPDIVKRAVHFMAIDEHRFAMLPTQFNEDERVTEIWVPGDHCDVGGGWYHDGISDTVLECMRMEATKAGLKCREITEETCKNEDFTILQPYEEFDADAFKEFDNDMKIKPNGLEPDVHDYSTSFTMRLKNGLNCFKSRKIYKMKNDKPADGEPILLLDIVVERVQKLKLDIEPPASISYPSKRYRPENLRGVQYKLVSSKDMTISEEVQEIDDVVDW